VPTMNIKGLQLYMAVVPFVLLKCLGESE
jgi:hypothetical protein